MTRTEDPMTPDDLPPDVRAALAQGKLIAEELRLRGRSFGATPAQVLQALNLATGELTAGLTIDGLTYSEVPADKAPVARRWGVHRELVVQREARGRLAWTYVGSDGEPVEPWTEIAPPPSRSASN
jgi:hypothetical protein